MSFPSKLAGSRDGFPTAPDMGAAIREASPELRVDLSDLQLLKGPSKPPCCDAMPMASSNSTGRVGAGVRQGWKGRHSHQEAKC